MMYIRERAGSIWVKDMHFYTTLATFDPVHGYVRDVQERSPLVSDGEENKKSLTEMDFFGPTEVSEHIKESSLQITSRIK